MRDDPRNAVHVVGKSINLALSERGRSALRSLGLEDMILDKYSIKMHARMIHDLNGNKRKIKKKDIICTLLFWLGLGFQFGLFPFIVFL